MVEEPARPVLADPDLGLPAGPHPQDLPELAVGALLWLVFAYPIVALCILALLVAFTIWIIPKVWRMIRAIVERILAFFDGSRRSQH